MGKKLTKEIFIERSNIIHNNFYDYSLVDYINSTTKVKIICPIHGIFEQLPPGHLRGKCCKQCSGTSTGTTEDFIIKANEIHKNKYDYSLVDYKNAHNKIKIICPIHGIFEQKPNTHLNGKGCLGCSGKQKLNTKEFITRANKVHHNFYDYSLVDYKGAQKKVKIICPKHGIFEQKPSSHVNLKQGCPLCVNLISKGEIEVREFIQSFYKGELRFNDRIAIKPKELDIYIPDLNIGVEFNGEYWHKLYENKNPGYHKRKRILCLENNIKIINISYKSWNNNPDRIKKLILEKCQNVQQNLNL